MASDEGGNRTVLQNGVQALWAIAKALQEGLPISAGVSTVSGLPTSPIQGMRRMVTDATATTFNSTVAGGGANIVPVFWDGANWKIG